VEQTVRKILKKVLTVPTDRSPALRGITADIARLSGAKFSMGTLDIHLIEKLDWCINCALHERPATRQPNILTWCWASTGQPIKFDTNDFLEKKEWNRWATELSLDRRQIRVRTCFQIFQITPVEGPSPCWGQGHWAQTNRCAKYGSRSNDMSSCTTSLMYKGYIVFDTLQDALHQERGDIMCILWKERTGLSGDTHHTTAIIIVPVEEGESTYRRRGWMDIAGDGIFQDEPGDIILV